MAVFSRLNRIWKKSNDFEALDSKISLKFKEKIGKLKNMSKSGDFPNLGKYYETYLLHLIRQTKLFLVLGQLHIFLEVSGFTGVLGDKIYHQSVMRKKVGGHYNSNKCMKCLKGIFTTWRFRWFAITSEGVCYAKKLSTTPQGVIDMLFFDKTVQVVFGKKDTSKEYGISIYTSSRKLTVNTFSKFQLFILLKAMLASIKNSPYISYNRFNSFSPIRMSNYARCFINAADYFSSLYTDLKAAKYEIFIRGWWLSPELYLKRPSELNQDSRLDMVLHDCAKR